MKFSTYECRRLLDQETFPKNERNVVHKLSNLVIAYSLQNTFDLRGTAEGLAALGELLIVNKAPILTIELIRPQQSPHPYSGFVENVLIQNEPHMVVVSRMEDTLVITGDDESLSLLGQSIKWLATNGSAMNDHIHVDFYPGSYLEPSSEPLVVTIVEADELR